MRVMTYTTEVALHDFRARPEHNGMTVRCVTMVTGLVNNHTTAQIEVNCEYVKRNKQTIFLNHNTSANSN